MKNVFFCKGKNLSKRQKCQLESVHRDYFWSPAEHDLVLHKMFFNFFQFRFAEKQDLALIFVGILAAMIAGVMMPIMIVLFGGLTDAFVQNDGSGSLIDANQTIEFCLLTNMTCCDADLPTMNFT